MSIKASIATFTGSSPVDAVMGVFTKTITDLKQIQATNNEKAEGLRARQAILHSQAVDLSIEATRAGTLAGKLEDLLK